MIDKSELREGAYLVECEAMNNNPPLEAVAFVIGEPPFLQVVVIYKGHKVNLKIIKYLRKIL